MSIIRSYKLNQNITPLFDALKEYVDRDIIPFHVPGHKKGDGIDSEFKDFIGENAFKIDVTSFSLVDSLHNPIGAIKRAQELAADAYGADASFFSTNGTSGAIQAMIMSVVNAGEKIIIPRNVHKSITAGVILSGAHPVYMPPETDKKLGIAHGITIDTVTETLKNNPDAKALLIINPTYYGVATDIKEICKVVHQFDIPLIVDEAHGPHLGFNSKLPVSAMDAGADACAQSTHKIIGALTQASLLHVRSKYIDVRRVQQILNILQTTSPSYILMASLDCARRQIAIHGEELLNKTIELSNYARKQINSIPGLYCFGDEIRNNLGIYTLDPTKITITCKELGITGYELEIILANKYNIQVELSDLYNVLAVGSFGDTKENIDKLINALHEISYEFNFKQKMYTKFNDIPAIPEQILIPSEAFNSIKSSVPLEESIGMISGEFLLAYPPGIPVLCPGEKISDEIVNYIKELKNGGLYIQGTEDQTVENIKVVKTEDAVYINVELQ